MCIPYDVVDDGNCQLYGAPTCIPYDAVDDGNCQ